MLRSCLALVLLAAAATGAQAQGCLTTVLPNDGGTSGNARAPIANFRFARTAYLIKPSEMAAAPGFPSGSQPLSIAWTYTTAPGVAATAPLTIYMQNTSDVTYTKGTAWSTVISGMTPVHSASTTIPNVAGTFEITLTGGSPFTYTGGGLYIAFDWGNYTGTLGTAVISCNSTGLAGGLAGAQSNVSAPTTLTASNFRPQTLLRPVAGLSNDASVDLVMALGRQPLGITGPQTMQARVSNKGSGTITNLAVTLTVSGANAFTDTQIIPSLAACGGAATVTFAPFTATALGNNTVTVSVPNDDATVNNSLSKPMQVSVPYYSYKHLGTAATGGVGLTGGVGAFVAKFTTTQPTSVISADLEFFSVAATTYRVAIYGDAGGIPSTTPIYVDATDRTVAAAGPVTITLPTPVPVGPGSFYLGVQQTNTTNASYSYDAESPLRSGTFFFSGALPVTAWTDLSPANGFKLNIGVTLDRCNFTPSASNDGPFCPGGNLQLSASATAAASYLWIGPNGFISNLQNPQITGASAAAAGTYTVLVNGCPPGTTTDAIALADADGDGTCDINDGCPNDPNKTAPGNCGCGVPETGDSDSDGTVDCNDGCPNDPNKIAAGNCGCGLPETGDTDGDGLADCIDNCPTVVGQIGSACDDGNPATIADQLDANCTCVGQTVDCLGVPNGPDVPGTPCNDNSACTINDAWSPLCVCTGTFQDADADGVCDTNDNCPTVPGQQGSSCSDGDPCTINDVLDANCVCTGTPAPVVPGASGSAATYCTPGAGVTLTATGGVSYTWAPATGLSATTGAVVTATPASATTYTVTVTNANGCTGQATVSVGTGTTPAAPTASALPASTCPGGTSQLNVAGAVPALVVTISGTGFMDEVSWTLTNASNVIVGSGGPYGSGSTNVAPIANPGLSPFVLFAETQGSFNDNTLTYTVTCGGNTILTGFLAGGQSFTSSPVGCSASYTYSWTPATFLSSSTIANPVASGVTTTTTYTASATNASGCSASTTVTVTVNPLAIPPITGVTATPNPVCPGSDAQLQVSTSAPLTYCVPTLSFGCSFPDQISNVVVAGISRASGCDNLSGSNGYSNFASPTGALVAGSTGNSYSITTSGDTEGAALWIDFNQDGAFGPGEQIFNSYAGTSPATYSGTFTVPAGALNGATRLRVRCTYAQAPGADACGPALTYGETEDYTVVISGGVTPYSFSWSPATYLNNAAIADPLASAVTAATTYTVTVTDVGGCQNTATLTLNVETLDTDGDLTVDCADGCPTDANKTEPGQCGCGVPDTDTDGDLTADCIDGCPSDPLKIAPGICGCGVADTDTDGDATADCFDLCPTDPNKIVPGVCGCGVPDTDTDNDGIADCIDSCPLVSGVIGTACNDNNPATLNDALDANCVCTGSTLSCPDQSVVLDLTTDNSGAQTSWDIVNVGTSNVQCSGSGYLNNQSVSIGCCLATGCYELRVFDSAGDGMANGTIGGYVLRLPNGTRIIDNSGDGIFTFTSQISNNLGFCVPVGTNSVIPAHCDKANWLPNEVIQAQVNAAVTAQFGVTNSTSGYQFWFFSPDGGYTRRVLQTHASPGVVTGAPANVRAAYLDLSSLTTSPLPLYTNLNVRIRVQIAGVYSEWGPACRFRIDPPCATTQLTTSANPVVSCGATGLTLTSTVYANNVAGANRYQFEFSRPGYLRRIASTTRSQVLNWVTNPLQNNTCYNVRVRVSFDGGTTYCAFGPTCTVTVGTAFCGFSMPTQPETFTNATETGRLTVFPNPNNGDQVTLVLSSFDRSVNNIQVDVNDIYGKFITRRNIAVQDGYMNTVLSFEQELAPGMYLLNLQAGEQRFTQRMIVQ